MNLDEWYRDQANNDSASSWCATSEGSGAEDLGTPGLANEACPSIDRDGDGFSLSTGDCDEADATVNPGALEVPYDGVDNDCDETTLDDDLDEDGFLFADDCDDTDASDYPMELYPDLDLDTFGDASPSPAPASSPASPPTTPTATTPTPASGPMPSRSPATVSTTTAMEPTPPTRTGMASMTWAAGATTVMTATTPSTPTPWSGLTGWTTTATA
jgi:hypothetical protein